MGILLLMGLPPRAHSRLREDMGCKACPLGLTTLKLMLRCNLVVVGVGVVAPSGDGWARPSSWETPSAHLRDHQTTTRGEGEEAASHQEA